MSLIAISQGLPWPFGSRPQFSVGTGATIDATGEKVAFIGRAYLEGRSSGKTINTTGSSNLIWSVGSGPVFDNASSEFRAGFQGVDVTTGIPARPDGTWLVYTSVTTAADSTPTLTTSSGFHEKTPTSGSLSISHGDLVAFVLEMTARAGSDSLAVLASGSGSGTPGGFPCCVNNTSGSWAGTAGVPTISFVCSDGTVGFIQGGFPITVSAVTWADASNPDEYGEIFRVPFDCKVDSLQLTMRTADTGSDFTVTLYADPLGTPSSLASIVMQAESFGASGTEYIADLPLASEVSLTANTDYAVAVKATGAGNIRFGSATLHSAASRVLLGPGAATMQGATRNNSSGAFTGSTTTHYPLGVRISQVQDGAGSGGGLLTHPGMAGGMRG